MLHSMLTLAQQSSSDPNATLIAGVGIAVFLIAFLIGLAIAVLIAYLFYVPAKAIPQPFQQMSPGLVFLMLIPIFSIIWNFFVVLKISGGYKAYFDSIGRTDVGDCGKTIGLVYAIAVVCCIIPLLNLIAWIVALVCMIIFLVKVWGLKNQIAAAPLVPAA